jgi:HSP20 family protein
MAMTKRNSKKTEKESSGGLEGLLRGLTDFVDSLGELAEQGEQLSRTGEFQWQSGTKDAKGVFGFTVKTGLGGEGVKVEPFGNIKKDKATGRSVVQEVREPLIDMLEERDHLLLVAEMPGIQADQVKIEIKEDILTLTAANGDKKYHKELLLPKSYDPDKVTISAKNGIVEIRCQQL